MDYLALTKAFGIMSLIFSLGFLFHLRHYERMAREMIGHPAGFILGGILPVFVGCMIVNIPTDMIQGWPILTIMGWILLLVGILRVWCVHWWVEVMKQNTALVPVLFAIFGLIFGCLLCYAGFVLPMVAHY